MKPLITIAAGALFASSAYSQTVIRIVASNGDRNATQTAISKLLDNGWRFHGNTGPLADPGDAGDISKATGSNWGAWNGSFQGSPVIIKTTYAGALAGVAAVSGQQSTWRFVVSNATPSDTGNLPDPLTGTNLGVDYETGKADFGFSTNFQSTSPFNGVYQGISYPPVDEIIVGVSPLGFYASPGFPIEGANITTQLAQLLYTTGSVSLAQFTGNFAADENKIVWALGRNTDAGQRFGAYTEIGLGTSATVSVWDPRPVPLVPGPGVDTSTGVTGQTTVSGITYGGTVQTHRLWPAETISTIYSPEGSGGFSSGANLAAFLTVTLGENAYKGRFPVGPGFAYVYPAATAGYYIGYLTPGDANPRVLGTTGIVPPANRGVALSYNGVPLISDNVRNGKYTAWLYNRLLKPTSLTSGLQYNLATALANQIATVDAPAGGGLFDDATFRVQRFTDGGLVIPK